MKWRDVEGEFSVDLDSNTWSFEGAGTVPVANTKGGAVLRHIASSSGQILQRWEYGGRQFFYGLVTVYSGKPTPGMVKPMIQGSCGEWDGVVTMYLGSSAAIQVTGMLEGELSGAEIGGSNQGN